MAVPGRTYPRGFRCLWLLEELDAEDFEIIMLKPGEADAARTREYGARFAAKLPTALMDDAEISESSLVRQLLADRLQSTLNVSGAREERAALLQWTGCAETCVMLRVRFLRTDIRKRLTTICTQRSCQSQ